MFEGPFSESILKRATEKKLVEIHVHNIRDYSTDKHRRVDDYPFGGDAGMVMMIEPIYKAIKTLKKERAYDRVIFTTPDGELFDQKMANYFSTLQNIIILCGHYKGIDQRIRDHLIDQEVSIGNYVLTGGELAAAVMTDAIVRLIPGVLHDETSALTDSFQDDLLSPPVYTRPCNFKGWRVPEILLSGDDGKIQQWKLEKAIERTKKRRPDLLDEENTGKD